MLEIAARYGATNVRVFGSVARGEDGPGSDVDLLVDLPAGFGLFALIGLERELGEALGVPVDVGAADQFRAERRDEVLREAVPL